MVKHPIFIFEDTTSTGLDVVPLNRVILIEDSNGLGDPLLIILIDKTGITAGTTINTLLNLPTLWKDMGSVGGVLKYTASAT